jgi:parallel beta-helix repeat protein
MIFRICLYTCKRNLQGIPPGPFSAFCIPPKVLCFTLSKQIMQKSVKDLHRHWLGLAGVWVQISCCFFTLLLTACEKELQPAPQDAALKTGDEWALHGVTPDRVVAAGTAIQAAVDAAAPGEVIGIEAGHYREAVVVDKANLTLVGKAGVTIINPGEAEDGISVTANGDGFKLYNVTLRDFKENGVFLEGADDYILSRVTTVNCGEYGLFPVDSNRGLIEFCAASGHTDSGIYIGQSADTELRNNRAFENVIGFEIENCSRVVASQNLSYDNTAGMLVVLLPGLPVTTSTDILLNNNLVVNNNRKNVADPGAGFESIVPRGTGILVVGTDNTRLERNLILKNDFLGIAVVSTRLLGELAGLPPEAFALIEPNPDGIRAVRNVVNFNGAAPPDLPVPIPGMDLFWDGTGTANCWRGNSYTAAYPAPLPACP